MFTLLYLLSSILMFNCKAPITDQTMDLWKHLTTLNRYFTVSDEADQNDFNMVYYSPRLLWLLRDSENVLKDQQGSPIKPDQYLENVLLDNRSTRPETIAIKQCVRNYMKVRECIAFPTPDRSGQSASFDKQLMKLKERIYSKSTCKQMDGLNITCGMFSTYINELVEAINSGQQFSLLNVWDAVVEKECAIAYMEATEFHKQFLKDKFLNQEDAYSDQFLEETLQNIRDESICIYTKLAYLSQSYNELYQEYLQKLQAFIEQKETLLYQINSSIAAEKNKKLLDNLLDSILARARAGYYKSNNLQELANDMNDVFDNYARAGIGAGAVLTLKQKLSTVNPILISCLVDESRKIGGFGKNDMLDDINLEQIEANLEKNVEVKSKDLARQNREREEANMKLKRIREENYDLVDKVKKLEAEREALEKQKRTLISDGKEQSEYIERVKGEIELLRKKKRRWWQCS